MRSITTFRLRASPGCPCPGTSSQEHLKPSSKIKELWVIIMLSYILETSFPSIDLSRYPTLQMKWTLDQVSTHSQPKKNHLNWSTDLQNLLELTFTWNLQKPWTSHVNKLGVLLFTFLNIFPYIFYIPVYIFLCMFKLKYTLVGSIRGHIEVPRGECQDMCLGLPFLSWWWGWSGHPLWCSAQSDSSAQMTRHMHRLSSQKGTWHFQSIVWWCTNDVGLLDKTFMSHLHQGWGI